MSRSLVELHPLMRPLVCRFLEEAGLARIDLLVTCTWRSNAEQAALYAQGRTSAGLIRTNAKPGQSMHNVTLEGDKPASLAVDVVPLLQGKPVWNDRDPLWREVGRIGKAVGLAWYGDPGAEFYECAHFQHPQAATIAQGIRTATKGITV